MTTKALLIASAAIEAPTGLALVAVPSVPASLLLGATLDTPAAITVCRVAGAALLALGVACWLARRDERSRAARGVIAAMLVYDVAAAAIFVLIALGPPPHGVGLWPAALLHAALGGWCLACLRGTRAYPQAIAA